MPPRRPPAAEAPEAKRARGDEGAAAEAPQPPPVAPPDIEAAPEAQAGAAAQEENLPALADAPSSGDAPAEAPAVDLSQRRAQLKAEARGLYEQLRKPWLTMHDTRRLLWRLHTSDPELRSVAINFARFEGFPGVSLGARTPFHMSDSEPCAGTLALAEALRGNACVTSLQLNGCTLSALGSTALYAALRNHPSLTALVVDRGARLCFINWREPAETPDLLAQLLQAPGCRLTELSLVRGCVDDWGAAALGSALWGNRTLRKLNLARNSITCRGVIALAAPLHTATALTALDLAENSISDVGAAVLAKALQMPCHTPALRTLDLCRNFLHAPGERALAAAQGACEIAFDRQRDAPETAFSKLVGEAGLPLRVRVGGSPMLVVVRMVLGNERSLLFEARPEGCLGDAALVVVKLKKETTVPGDNERDPAPNEWAVHAALSADVAAVPAAPRMLFTGRQGGYHVLVMQRAGPSLMLTGPRKLRVRPLEVGIAALSALERFHETGFVHRNIKPSTLVLGGPVGSQAAENVLLCSLGSARRWRDETTGEHIAYLGQRPRDVGITYIFASMHHLLGRTYSRRDDLESLAYALVAMGSDGHGDHLLSRDRAFVDCSSPDMIFMMARQRMQKPNEITRAAPQVLEFLRRVMALSFAETPDYEALRAVLAAPAPAVDIQRPLAPLEDALAQGWLFAFDSGPVRTQRIYPSLSTDEVFGRMAEGRDASLFVSALACRRDCDRDAWSVVLDSETGFTEQVAAYFVDQQLQTDWVKERWHERFIITAVAIGSDGSGCLVVMSKGPGARYTQQSFKTAENYVSVLSWVSEKWRQGFCITSLAASQHGARWAVVVSKDADIVAQRIDLDHAYPAEALRLHWAAGFRLTCCTASAGAVAMVLSQPRRPTAVDAQETLRSPDFPDAELRARGAEGMAVTALAFGRTYAARAPPPPGLPVPMQRDHSAPLRYETPPRARQNSPAAA